MWIDGPTTRYLSLISVFTPFPGICRWALYTDLHTRWKRVALSVSAAWATVTLCALSMVPKDHGDRVTLVVAVPVNRASAGAVGPRDATASDESQEDGCEAGAARRDDLQLVTVASNP